jgi:hypothetical protein
LIRGKRWQLVFCDLPRRTHGECDPPDLPNKQIRVGAKLDEKDTLETIIHEALHAADWDKTEAWIEEVGRDIARILWRLGYRVDDGEVGP